MAVGGIVSLKEPNSHLYTLCTSSRFNRMLICNAGLENSKKKQMHKKTHKAKQLSHAVNGVLCRKHVCRDACLACGKESRSVGWCHNNSLHYADGANLFLSIRQIIPGTPA